MQHTQIMDHQHEIYNRFYLHIYTSKIVLTQFSLF
jgi:hypothetical protein